LEAALKEERKKQLAKMRREESERRKLHNMMLELKGNIRVFCRLRPLVGDEKQAGAEVGHISIQDDGGLELYKTKDATASSIAGGLNKDMKYKFEFDQVFGTSSSQAYLFSEMGELVQSALDGYNVCVFAYGQTGSGKTFTMEGGEEAEAGMIPRTVSRIFEAKEQLKELSWVYRLHASFLEIYNEAMRDLLATEKDLKYEIKGGADMTVTNLTVEEVKSEARVAELLQRAGSLRAQAKTLCNERSSRSHSVFVLKIEGTNSKSGELSRGALNMVDLAGSERIKDSGSSSGMRLKEAQAINNSLANLGNVIMALAQKVK
jgi:kinesin family protein C1